VPLEGKYVVFSDVHRGNRKDKGDDFKHNEDLYLRALDHYMKHDFALVLAGDVEDGWECNCETIIEAYRESVYEMERRFVEKGAYYRVWGNHDSDWADSVKVERLLAPALGNVAVYPALVLGDKIVIVHGHQGDLLSDVYAWASRLFNKYFWKPVLQDRLGMKNTLRTAYSTIRGHDRDKSLYAWATRRKMLLIAGHTHRGMFESYSKADRMILKAREAGDDGPGGAVETPRLGADPAPSYFNDGCCIFTDGMTAIEIDAGQIRLVKWEYPKVAGGAGAVPADGKAGTADSRQIYESANLASILHIIRKGTVTFSANPQKR
jgi:UDP-2,3-diacylglucosamine pyrophosphatase LpxH